MQPGGQEEAPRRGWVPGLGRTVLAGVLVKRRSSTGHAVHRVGVCPLREARLGLRRVLHRQTASHVHAADAHAGGQSGYRERHRQGGPRPLQGSPQGSPGASARLGAQPGPRAPTPARERTLASLGCGGGSGLRFPFPRARHGPGASHPREQNKAKPLGKPFLTSGSHGDHQIRTALRAGGGGLKDVLEQAARGNSILPPPHCLYRRPGGAAAASAGVRCCPGFPARPRAVLG